ncbi:hypothetical protein [Actinoplanes siamensis]|uniref:Lipoprotein n=1 Tax=Actinoplanes siamensis TaxID=1223317 RepID=A0A919NEY9_9ACTN|nr:hypothetical protein [Actinoplanes siamensis]GIF09633.1 hypothetical protein Asi03nite_71710 [Actinoplanes siamensis]
MHRLAHVFGATTLVVLVAACGNTTTRHDEATAPAGPSSSAAAPADSASKAAEATATPRPPSNTSPISQPVKATRTDPADLTIHPDRIGPLKIGMSLAAAKATGLIVVNAGQDTSGPDACVSAHWTGQSDHAWMVFNGKSGLRALDSFGNQKTPEGIKPGSTLAAVRRAYPHLTWRIDGDETPDGRRTGGDALVDVVKGDGAHYRINVQKSKVTDVQLESDRAGCYE